MDRYPNAPGHRGVDTSIAAAKSCKAQAATIREKVRVAVCAAGWEGATGDDIASDLGLSVFQIRSRTSELRAAGVIVDSGRRRKGASGRAAIVWTLPHGKRVDAG